MRECESGSGSECGNVGSGDHDIKGKTERMSEHARGLEGVYKGQTEKGKENKKAQNATATAATAQMATTTITRTAKEQREASEGRTRKKTEDAGSAWLAEEQINGVLSSGMHQSTPSADAGGLGGW